MSDDVPLLSEITSVSYIYHSKIELNNAYMCASHLYHQSSILFDVLLHILRVVE